MAVDAATFLTYSAIGNREDLSDVIYNIDPTETPFISGVDKIKASATFHEWQTQALDAVNSTNSVLEGDDAATDTLVATGDTDAPGTAWLIPIMLGVAFR